MKVIATNNIRHNKCCVLVYQNDSKIKYIYMYTNWILDATSRSEIIEVDPLQSVAFEGVCVRLLVLSKRRCANMLVNSECVEGLSNYNSM